MTQPAVTIPAAQRTQRIIWGAITLSEVLLLVVLVLVEHPRPPSENASAVDLPLSLVAIAFALGASSYRRFAYSDSRLQKMGELAVLHPPEARLIQVLQLVQVPMVVSLALNEVVALLGFVLGFLHQDPLRYLPFFAVALVLNLLVFPRPARLIERMRQLVPRLGALALLLAVFTACSFRGGDHTPLAKEAETPCSLEAEAFCKEKLGSADFGNCVAREKYRCELLEQEKQGDAPAE